jgi:hypothetical protein
MIDGRGEPDGGFFDVLRHAAAVIGAGLAPAALFVAANGLLSSESLGPAVSVSPWAFTIGVACTLVLGLPAYLTLRLRGSLTGPRLVGAGIALTATLVVVLGLAGHDFGRMNFYRALGVLVSGTAFGGAAAAAFALMLSATGGLDRPKITRRTSVIAFSGAIGLTIGLFALAASAGR